MLILQNSIILKVYLVSDTDAGKGWKCCRKLIDSAIEASDLEGFLVKDLRRLYDINLSENGAEMHVIQAMLGHCGVRYRFWREAEAKDLGRKWDARAKPPKLRDIR